MDEEYYPITVTEGTEQIGIASIRPIDGNLYELLTIPYVNNRKYYHLAIAMTLEKKPKLNEMKTLELHNNTIKKDTEDYEKLLDNHINDAITKNPLETQETYGYENIKKDLHEYMQIEHRIYLLRRQDKLTNEEEKRLIQHKEKVKSKLQKLKIIK